MNEITAPDRIDDDRRRFLGAAAMTVAAFELGRAHRHERRPRRHVQWRAPQSIQRRSRSVR